MIQYSNNFMTLQLSWTWVSWRCWPGIPNILQLYIIVIPRPPVQPIIYHRTLTRNLFLCQLFMYRQNRQKYILRVYFFQSQRFVYFIICYNKLQFYLFIRIISFYTQTITYKMHIQFKYIYNKIHILHVLACKYIS